MWYGALEPQLNVHPWVYISLAANTVCCCLWLLRALTDLTQSQAAMLQPVLLTIDAAAAVCATR